MSVDVVYQGLSIAKEARVHFEEGGLFVETAGPMPVATELQVSHGEKSLTGRVRRVREGTNAGMLIVAADASKLPRWLIALHPETAGAAQFEPEAPAVAPPPVVEKAAPVEKAAEPSASSPEPAAEPAPSNRTPETDSDDKKHAGTAASKKKKPKRR